MKNIKSKSYDQFQLASGVQCDPDSASVCKAFIDTKAATEHGINAIKNILDLDDITDRKIYNILKKAQNDIKKL